MKFETADTNALSNTDMATVAPADHSGVALQYILAFFHVMWSSQQMSLLWVGGTQLPDLRQHHPFSGICL